jgi:hypothetical protein
MGLPARQRRVLDRIEDTLRGSDPRLVTMFAIFGRLTRDEEMPRIEELRHRAAIRLLRVRLWLAAVRGWVRGRVGHRRPMRVLFPVALLLMTVTIVLVARFGGSSRCTTTPAVAVAKPHPKSKLLPKCRPAMLNPLVFGR